MSERLIQAGSRHGKTIRLNERGQCCGRKPHVYKGGAWNSPPEAPMQVCHCCGAIYELDTGVFREWSSWTPDWKRKAMEERHG